MTTQVWIFLAYFAVVFAIGWYSLRATKDEADYWIAGGGLGWLTGGATLAATHTSAGTFVGTIGVMYTAGWSFGWVLLSIPLSYWFLVAVVAPRLTRQRELTLPAFIETRYYGKGIRGLAASIILVATVVYIQAQIVAGGIIANTVFGIPTSWGMVGFTAILLVYTVVGGMLAVLLPAEPMHSGRSTHTVTCCCTRLASASVALTRSESMRCWSSSNCRAMRSVSGDESLTIAVNGSLLLDDVDLVIQAALDGAGLAWVAEDPRRLDRCEGVRLAGVAHRDRDHRRAGGAGTLRPRARRGAAPVARRGTAAGGAGRTRAHRPRPARPARAHAVDGGAQVRPRRPAACDRRG